MVDIALSRSPSHKGQSRGMLAFQGKLGCEGRLSRKEVTGAESDGTGWGLRCGP